MLLNCNKNATTYRNKNATNRLIIITMPQEHDSFANLLKARLKNANLKPKQIADIIDIDRSNVYQWLKGNTTPRCNDKTRKGLLACIKPLNFQTVNEFNQFLQAAGQPVLTEAEEQKYFPHSKTEPQPQHQSATHETPDIIEDNLPALPIINLPINLPHQFFGREKKLEQIFDQWKQPPLFNVAVIGPRRSGKTSLLHYIKNIHRATRRRKGQRKNWLKTDTNFVFIDFQAAGMTEQKNLFSYILQELHFTVPEPCNFFQFTQIMRSELLKPTVLLMDRIDVGLETSELDYRFWWGIRSLVTNDTNGNLGLLLASPKLPTPAMPCSCANQPSPFLNIFSEIVELEPLTDKEARELLQHAPQPFDDADKKWILKESGCWPALLQVLLDVRLRAIDENEIGDAWKKEGLERIQKDGYLSNLYNNRNERIRG